ncbi:MAG: archaeosortase/exosortase family protein [Bacteroidota bacterium]
MQLSEITNSKYYIAFKDVALFIIITLAFHFFFRAIAGSLDKSEAVNQVTLFFQKLLFDNSTWIIRHILCLDFVTDGLKMTFTANNGYVAINSSCSGLKIFLQFIVLMVLFPGPWKHKLWYIPAGLVMIHVTNIFRIVGLAQVTVSLPQYWNFSHDYFFRPLFYVVIFIMWVIWVEYFYMKKEKI